MTILIGIPTYDNKVESGLAVSLLSEMRYPGCPPYTVAFKQSSLLAYAHNELLCIARNNQPEITHLLLVHADILPDPGFLAQMFKDMAEAQADVLGVVIPIKDSKGLTSTALLPHLGDADKQGRREYRRRRLTITECARLPDIFDVRDLQHVFGEASEDGVLLVNTGMLLINLAAPFVSQVHFEINDDIFTGEDGLAYADVEPEDWYFSRQAAAHGARLCVTRRVSLRHVGRANFPNQVAWGEWAHDQAWKAPEPKRNGQHEPETTLQV